MAAGKPARQSSTYKEGVAWKAVDGGASAMWKDGSCSSTSHGDRSPWWQVDLEATRPIKEVAILL